MNEKTSSNGEKSSERMQETQKGRGKGVTIALYLVVLVVVIALAAFLTLSVSVMSATPGTSHPFTTRYAVTFPEGQPITIGSTHITVLSFQNELISDIDGARQKLVEGEDRAVAERRAVITTFGVITLIDTNFRIDLKYKGNRDNLAYFDMAIHTSRQVPDILLNRLIPPEIHAQPI